MTRFHIQETVLDTNGDPLDTATVTVCVLGTTEASRETLYADADSATTLDNPLTSDGSGLVDFYLAHPLVCDLRPVKAGVAGRTVTVRPGLPDVGDVPTWDGRQDVHQAPLGGGPVLVVHKSYGSPQALANADVVTVDWDGVTPDVNIGDFTLYSDHLGWLTPRAGIYRVRMVAVVTLHATDWFQLNFNNVPVLHGGNGLVPSVSTTGEANTGRAWEYDYEETLSLAAGAYVDLEVTASNVAGLGGGITMTAARLEITYHGLAA